MRRLALFGLLAALLVGLAAGCGGGTQPVRKTNSHFDRYERPDTAATKR